MSDHIKVPDVAPIVRYVANGTQTTFQYPFPAFASEDIKIYFDGAPQYSGFDVTGSGNTNGGSVTFDTSPPSEIIITIERRLPLERITDFLEGGDFSATSINKELDYLVASVQQVNRENATMLKYSDHETTANTILPDRMTRRIRRWGLMVMVTLLRFLLRGLWPRLILQRMALAQ